MLSDPIFWVVAFLISGTPSSLQLTQITQIHGIWDRELARVLWWGYAVFAIPSIMIGVILSLELLEWCRS
jgi:auxin efflux carrier family protein